MAEDIPCVICTWLVYRVTACKPQAILRKRESCRPAIATLKKPQSDGFSLQSSEKA